jgi:hypothetical protein
MNITIYVPLGEGIKWCNMRTRYPSNRATIVLEAFNLRRAIMKYEMRRHSILQE